jgi:hypothetical protein
MRKELELSDPNSCLNKARPGEILFVLLSRDKAAPGTIRDWCERRIAFGLNEPGDPQILEAKACAAAMEVER